MGDMSSGGAPRIKSIVENLKTIVENLTEIAGSTADGSMQTTMRRSDGTEIGTAENPIHVDICGEVPDTMDITHIGGEEITSGSGDADVGTLRVAVAEDDVNLVAIKDDIESILTQIDSKTSTLAKENGGNLVAIKLAIEATRTALDGVIETSLQTSIPAGTNEIGGVDLTKVGGELPTLGVGDVDTGTLRVAIASDDVNLSAIKVATEAAIFRNGLDQVVDTGSDTLLAVYAPVPARAFRLEYVTIHLSSAPTTPGDVVVWLNSGGGDEYNVALFRVDPSEDPNATDICYIPDRPIPCMDGDSVSVTYENDDNLTYGVRIVTRGA